MTLPWWAALAAAPPAKVNADAVYKKHCQVCHSPDGKGYAKFEPPDFTYSKWQGSISDAQMREGILNGSPPMPAFKDKLSAAEVEALVRKVRAFGKPKTSPRRRK